MPGKKVKTEVVYLHDIPVEYRPGVGANRSNVDSIDSVRRYLELHPEVLLTADDGYASVRNLLPLLEEFKAKLILFVTTGFIDKSIYPYEVAVSNFLEKHKSCIYKGKNFEINTYAQKDHVFRTFHRDCKPAGLGARKNALAEFLLENSANESAYRGGEFMSWEEVRDVASHPLVEIGSHCVSHLFLPGQSIPVIYNELRASKFTLQRKLKCNVTKLSYPYGAHNFTVRLLAWLVGYKCAYGTYESKPSGMALSRSRLV